MSASLFDRLLKVPFIRRSHVASYVVGYARDKGVLRILLKMGSAVVVKGPSAVFRPRGIVLNKLWIQKAESPIIAHQDTALRGQLDRWTIHPLISIVVPVYNTPPKALEKMIRSVVAQVYPNWELCITDDCSTQPGVRQVLDTYAGDARIKVSYLEKNAGISAATNQAIRISTGTYIGLLDHDDELTADALFWVVENINRNGPFDIIYTDECKTDEDSAVDSEVFYKPDWSPELLLAMMYPGHLTVYRKAFLEEEVGYFRSEYDFSQDYDLFLRASAKTENIRHIQKVLYRWRKISGSAAQGDKAFARESNIAALAAAIRSRGIAGEALAPPQGNRVRVHFDQETLLSLILPTNALKSARSAIDSIFSRTIYPGYEVIVIADAGILSALKDRYGSRLVYVPCDDPVGARNAGAAVAQGEILVFLDDTLRPLKEDWLVNLVEWLWVPGVGAVSPRLLYENGTIRYAGMVTGVRGLVGRAFHTYTTDTPAQSSFPKVHRNVSVLSEACLAIRRSLFEELGGFDAVSGPQDHTDLSFRIREHGQRLVFTAYAELRQTGRPAAPDFKAAGKAGVYLIRRWAKYLGEDPYFTPHMRELLYLDSPEAFGFYAPAPSAAGTPDARASSDPIGAILLTTSELSTGGASRMLLELARLLSTRGYFVVMAAEQDGPMRTSFQEAGFSVLVDALLFRGSVGLEALAGGFDRIICVSGRHFVDRLEERVPTIWRIYDEELSPVTLLETIFSKP